MTILANIALFAVCIAFACALVIGVGAFFVLCFSKPGDWL